MFARIGAIGLLLLAAQLTAAAADAMEPADPSATKPAKETVSADYPPALRERVDVSHGPARFETSGNGDATWLQTEAGAIIWSWKSRPDDAEEWRRMPTLSDTVTLTPDVEYSFDTVWLADCDELVIDYPFKADRGLLLRVREGDTVIFDALQEAARRSGKPPSALVSVRTPPTPAVAATVAAPAENSTLGAVLQKLIAARAFCESSAALQWKWREDEKAGALNGLAKSDIDPLVLVEQPLWESSVVVLVYDPRARGARSLEVSVLEGDCPDQYSEPGRTAQLAPVDYEGPLFIGRAEIEGAHGTVVKARYRRAGDEQRPPAVYESAPIGMAFH